MKLSSVGSASVSGWERTLSASDGGGALLGVLSLEALEALEALEHSAHAVVQHGSERIDPRPPILLACALW